ncbi:dihydrolipoamide acetyltransferase family protein [Aquiluna sp. KACHI24]|uniref:dihydrolipoamide acetyltransferase family protein n=1 Tax=Aquiluna sp. KACHI24 TaxID=2968831 RepID=UPI00220EBF3A|nr:dihydrolipoamide acetyltransferase family protein [Aquiluna sp. KACHI24]BDQ01033.1 dihydrolipoamide acetyltransferase component of pyruvate dehydrogenase complex [Aquiluna sp. KACHI24]
MSIAKFPLPDVGEGLTEAEIVSWKVAPGQKVEVNQTICEIETAKSIVELPCPFEGVVEELLAKEGETVEVGTPIISVNVTSGLIPTMATFDVPAEAVAVEADTGAEYKLPTLVGYGDTGEASSRRNRAVRQAPISTAIPVAMVRATTAADAVLAKPPIRKLAKELGVDLNAVSGTGAHGDITRDDVIGAASQASVFKNLTTPDAPSEREERIPVKGVRKAIASAMVKSAFTAPHVSIFVDVDATRTMEYVKRLKNSVDFAGIKVTPLLIMAKAMIWAVRRNRMVNSTWTDEEIIVHNFVNLGIAAATPRGLIVPNIKNADQMSMIELAQAIEQLAATAREGKTTPEDMRDGTITITNIGVFGVDTGTPILNPGEVGIVALGSIRKKPWVVDDEIVVRQITTIGATFDHRVVDGDVASRFVQDVASVIEEPALLLD